MSRIRFNHCPICEEGLYRVMPVYFTIKEVEFSPDSSFQELEVLREEVGEVAYEYTDSFNNDFEVIKCANDHTEDEMLAALQKPEDYDAVINLTVVLQVRDGKKQAARVLDSPIDDSFTFYQPDAPIGREESKLELHNEAEILLNEEIMDSPWPLLRLDTKLDEDAIQKIKTEAHEAGRQSVLAELAKATEVTNAVSG